MMGSSRGLPAIIETWTMTSVKLSTSSEKPHGCWRRCERESSASPGEWKRGERASTTTTVKPFVDCLKNTSQTSNHPGLDCRFRIITPGFSGNLNGETWREIWSWCSSRLTGARATWEPPLPLTVAPPGPSMQFIHFVWYTGIISWMLWKLNLFVWKVLHHSRALTREEQKGPLMQIMSRFRVFLLWDEADTRWASKYTSTPQLPLNTMIQPEGWKTLLPLDIGKVFAS